MQRTSKPPPPTPRIFKHPEEVVKIPVSKDGQGIPFTSMILRDIGRQGSESVKPYLKRSECGVSVPRPPNTQPLLILHELNLHCDFSCHWIPVVFQLCCKKIIIDILRACELCSWSTVTALLCWKLIVCGLINSLMFLLRENVLPYIRHRAQSLSTIRWGN